MALSRMVGWLLFGLVSSPSSALATVPWGMAPAPADPLGDLQRAERERSLAHGDPWPGRRAGCVRSDEEEILVCGRAEPDVRVASEPTPGARRRLIAGEPPGGVAALAAGGCIQRCHQPVQIDIISTTRKVVGLIGRLLD